MYRRKTRGVELWSLFSQNQDQRSTYCRQPGSAQDELPCSSVCIPLRYVYATRNQWLYRSANVHVLCKLGLLSHSVDSCGRTRVTPSVRVCKLLFINPKLPLTGCIEAKIYSRTDIFLDQRLQRSKHGSNCARSLEQQNILALGSFLISETFVVHGDRKSHPKTHCKTSKVFAAS